MDAKEKAISLVDEFRLILIKSNTDAGEEILCTLLAKECALVAVEEIVNALSYKVSTNVEEIKYFLEVQKEIEKL